MIKRLAFLAALFCITVGICAQDITGTWIKKHDLTLDGEVSGEVTETVITIQESEGELRGVYEGADSRPGRVFLDFFISPRNYSVDIVSFRYEASEAPSYYSTQSGIFTSDTSIAGTWYDTRGNSGDFTMERKDDTFTYIGGTYQLTSLDGKWVVSPASETVLLADSNAPKMFTIIQSISGTENISFQLKDNPGLYLRTATYFYTAEGNYSDADTGIHRITINAVDQNHVTEASFSIVPGLAGEGVSFESEIFPDYYICARDDGRWGGLKKLYLVKKSSDAEFKNDATFVLEE